MADNVLATPPKKQRERYRPELLKILDDYAARVANDFTSGLDRSAQGFGEMVDDGNYLTGVPRLALGGLQWMGSPVSAAVSPILGPVLQPVGEAVDTYVGQPVERATGYPADITNELFLTGVTAGAGPLLKPALKGTGNFLATMGDAAEAGLNRAGYTFRPPEGTFFSGAGPVRSKSWIAPKLGDETVAVYHGTGGDHANLMPQSMNVLSSGSREGPIGVWTTNDPRVASSFADFSARGSGANVRPLAIQLKNPLELKSYDEIRDLVDKFTQFERPGYVVGGRQIRMMGDKVDYDGLRAFLRDQGYDGIALRQTLTDSVDGQPIDQFVSLDPQSVSPRFGSLLSQPVKLDEAAQAADDGIIAYHGSPHSFDKFDMSKMGTGEGNQAFGNGLYFAQREGTADFYRSELTDQHGTPYKVDIAGKQEENPYIVSAAVDAKNYMNNANPSETMAAFNNAMSSHKADLQEKWDRFGGQLSNPDLHPVTRKSLDELRDALNRIDSVTPENFTVTSGSKYQVKIDAAPEDIKTYSGPSGIKAKVFAEQAKREGYKGIKYLDGWSRRAGSAEGATYNYVIFDDKLITILKKYGIPMTAGAGGAMMVSGEAMPPELAAQLQGGT